MPASIIQDSTNFTPKARAICLALFVIGTIALIVLASQMGKAVDLVKEHYAQERVGQIADSAPEQMTFELKSVSIPNTKEEEIIRTSKLVEELNLTAESIGRHPKAVLNQKGKNNPEKLISLGVMTGQIHPKNAQLLLEEVRILNISQSPDGTWGPAKN